MVDHLWCDLAHETKIYSVPYAAAPIKLHILTDSL